MKVGKELAMRARTLYALEKIREPVLATTPGLAAGSDDLAGCRTRIIKIAYAN